MATINPKKRKSPEPSLDDIDSNGGQPQTPTRSPPRKKLKVTHRQKQALIDNLQLEITERARKLRAHYALQAQDLKARIERRVNRIPVSLRKANMGELLEKYNQAKAATESEMFKKPTLQQGKTTTRGFAPQIASDSTGQRVLATGPFSPAVLRSGTMKDRSGHMVGIFDKENIPRATGVGVSSLANPKKRTNPVNDGSAATGGTAASRISFQRLESNILSPKSSNSRTFPMSPLLVRNISPGKVSRQPSRPGSPFKAATNSIRSAAPHFAEIMESVKKRATRGATAVSRKISPKESSSTAAAIQAPSINTTATSQQKRGVGTTRSAAAAKRGTAAATTSRPTTRQQQRNRQVSTATTTSSASTGTTIVKSTMRATKASTAKAASTAAANAKKAAATKKAATAATATRGRAAQAAEVAGPAPGRRVLRKRA